VSRRLARRYVQPLYDVGSEKDLLDQIANDLELVDKTLQESDDLRGFLYDPSIERQAKKDVLEKLFADISPYSLNFLRVIVDKNRSLVFDQAYPLFREMLNEHRGITTGAIETATPLDDASYRKVIENLEKRFDKKLELEQIVTPDLIGGIKVRIGNVVLDGSVRGQLAKLKKVMAGE